MDPKKKKIAIATSLLVSAAAVAAYMWFTSGTAQAATGGPVRYDASGRAVDASGRPVTIVAGNVAPLTLAQKAVAAGF